MENNIPFVEKYRPKTLDSIVLNTNNRILFNNILQMENLHQCIQVSFLTGGTEVEFESTLARELSFCLHHSYHHCASMKLIAFNNGFREAVPSGFGVAPSTSVYNNKG